MSRMLTTFFLTLLGVAALSAQPRTGQIDIEPFGGYFKPTASAIVEETTAGDLESSNTTAIAFGGRMTLWLNGAIGLEGAAMYVPSTLEGEAFSLPQSLSADFFYGTGKIILNFGPSDVLMFHANGGISFFNQSYELLGEDSGILGVVGAGARLYVTEGVAIRFDIEDYISNSRWQVGDQQSSSILQNDLIFTAGLTLSIGR